MKLDSRQLLSLPLGFFSRICSNALQPRTLIIGRLSTNSESTHKKMSGTGAFLDQVLEYKLRCQQMRMATNLGVLASIALTSSIVCSALGAIADTIAAFHYVSAGLSIVGLLLMIWAAVVVLIENARLQLIIESELSDVPELMQAAHDKHRVGAQARK